MSVRRKESLLSVEMAVGGHDKNFVLPPPPEVICKSCDMVARNPCKTQCDCRGIYCSGCSAKLMGYCQVCHKPLSPVNDIVTAHRVSTLPVKCDNSGRGCVWIGDLGQLDCHLLSCPLQQTHCSYHWLSCGVSLVRGEVDQHEESHVHRHLQLAVQHMEWLESRVQVAPIVFRMCEFDRRLKLNHGWVSGPFYSHPGGYRMCLSVSARGDGVGSGTHSSLYVCLMQGINDDALPWPFRGEVTVQLLNQLQDGGHRQETIHFTK
jgi:TNF receptor-associated factor 4